MNKRYLYGISALLIFQGCQNSSSNSSSIKDSSKVESNNTIYNSFDSIIVNFWNNFDFSDPKKVSQPEIGEQALVDFINLFPQASTNGIIATGIDSLISKSSNNKEVQLYFERLLNRYLYDANSPFYNEPYFVLALEKLISSPHVGESNKIRYKTLLQIANRNKVGDIATDFTFFSGKTQTLHSLSANYLVIFFYVPKCPSCEENLRILKENADLSAILNEKALTLAMYADGNENIWKEYADNIPKEWINGIDLDQQILKKGLYDLKASPTIYLLDKDKRVLLKDIDLYNLLDYLKNK